MICQQIWAGKTQWHECFSAAVAVPTLPRHNSTHRCCNNGHCLGIYREFHPKRNFWGKMRGRNLSSQHGRQGITEKSTFYLLPLTYHRVHPSHTSYSQEEPPSTTELQVKHWDQHLILTFLRSVTQFTVNLGLCLRGTGFWILTFLTCHQIYKETWLQGKPQNLWERSTKQALFTQ